jgi:hypothetical protein
MDDRPGFHLGGARANFVDVRLTAGLSSDWVPVLITVRVGSFLASYPALFQPGDFAALLDGVSRLNGSLRGIASLAPIEGQLILDIEGDGRGGIRVAGEAGDLHGDNRLVFSMDPIDQTYLPPLIDDLRAVLRHLEAEGPDPDAGDREEFWPPGSDPNCPATM